MVSQDAQNRIVLAQLAQKHMVCKCCPAYQATVMTGDATFPETIVQCMSSGGCCGPVQGQVSLRYDSCPENRF